MNDKPSYHDLYVTTHNIQRTSIFNLPFRIKVRCCRVAGWEVWALREGNLPEELLGGEFEGPDRGLRLDVNGFVIVDSFTRS